MSGINIQPLLTTNAQGSFQTSAEGLMQGVAMDDPAVRNQLAGGVLAAAALLPMFGGVGITEKIVSLSTNSGAHRALGGDSARTAPAPPQVLRFHHVDWWCADATSTYKRWGDGVGGREGGLGRAAGGARRRGPDTALPHASRLSTHPYSVSRTGWACPWSPAPTCLPATRCARLTCARATNWQGGAGEGGARGAVGGGRQGRVRPAALGRPLHPSPRPR